MDFDPTPVGDNVNMWIAGIESVVDRIIAKDQGEAEAARSRIKSNHPFCSGEELKNLEEDAQRLIAELNGLKEKPKEIWLANFEKDHRKPKELHAIDRDWEKVTSSVADVQQRVLQMSQQSHWEGPGAAAYMKQLPHQAAAVEELLSFSITDQQYLNRTAQLLQAIMLSLKSGLQEVKEALESRAGMSHSGSGVFFQRTADAIALLKECVRWMGNVRDGESWNFSVDQLNNSMSQALDCRELFAASNEWPQATSGGEGSTPRTSGSTGPSSNLPENYDPNSEVGKSAPSADASGDGLDVDKDSRY